MIRIVTLAGFDPSLGRSARDPQLARDVTAIIDRVAADGDDALARLTLDLDGVALDGGDFWVPEGRMVEAWNETAAEVRDALHWAWNNVRSFHAREPVPTDWEAEAAGGRYGQRVRALDRVGIYVPGGRYAYPSTVIMAAAPARAAGVGELILASPPGSDGVPHPLVLAAAHLVGCSRVLRLGGAQAVAAMALGTSSVPRVDKVIGPGNRYVQEAKRQLYGTVGIDLLAGPSELAIVAETGSNPRLLALDLLAQAEHGPSGRVLLLTPSRDLAGDVAAEIEALVAAGPDPERLRSFFLSASPVAVVTPTLEDAVTAAGRLETEHVLLAVGDPELWLPRLRGGAAVYLGAGTPPAYGDFGAGPTHVLPTGGSSAFSSGLSVTDFLRRQNFFRAAGSPAPEAETLARAEGLWAHAESLRARRAPAPMNANENPVPMPAHIRDRALSRAAGVDWRHYPPLEPVELTRALAGYGGVPEDHVTIGAGADELILASALAMRGFRWLILWPGFWIYQQALTWAGADLTLVDLEEEFSFPRQRLLSLIDGGDPSRTIVVAVNPNNPTGNLFPLELLAEVLDRGAWLLVDEAYWEYSGVTVAGWIGDRPRLMVLRTLSKAFGLAGLRVGYLLGQPGAVSRVRQHKLPLSVSSHSIQVACAALENRREILAGVPGVVRERDRLAGSLGALGLRVFDSSASFLLVEVGDAAGAVAWLARRGYLVRHFPAIPRIQSCMRVSVGHRADNDGLVAAVKEFLDERSGP